MLVKEIIKREFHFENNEERDNHMQIMKNEGYTVTEYGSEDDWYFTCKKEIIKKCKNNTCNSCKDGSCTRVSTNGQVGICWMEKSEGEY